MATQGLPSWPWLGITPEELPEPEAVLLEAIRRWSEAARKGGSPAMAMQAPLATLATLGIGEARDDLDKALRQLGAPCGMGCLLSPRVLPGEATLLLALALAQRGSRREALAIFLRLAPTPRAGAALAAAVALGQTLRHAGLRLTHPMRRATAGHAGRGRMG